MCLKYILPFIKEYIKIVFSSYYYYKNETHKDQQKLVYCYHNIKPKN